MKFRWPRGFLPTGDLSIKSERRLHGLGRPCVGLPLSDQEVPSRAALTYRYLPADSLGWPCWAQKPTIREFCLEVVNMVGSSMERSGRKSFERQFNWFYLDLHVLTSV